MKLFGILSLSLLVLSALFAVVPRVAAVASAVVQNDSMWVDSLGDLHVVGEVRNTGDVWLRFVMITGTLRDGSGGVVDVTNTYALLNFLPPDNVAPFDMFELDTAKSARVQSYSLAVEFQEAAALSQELVILNVWNRTDTMGYIEVVGEVENQGVIPSTYTQVTATLYDANGKVIYVGFTYTSPAEIPVGGKCGFDLDVLSSEQSSKVARYTLTAESTNSLFTSVPELSAPMLVAVIVFSIGVLAIRGKRHRFS